MKDRPYVLACSEIGVIHSLSETNIPIAAGSFFGDNLALFSKFIQKKVKFSTYSDQAFIDELISFGQSCSQKPLFISDDDRAILLFSEHREKLEQYFEFLMPEHHIVDAILDKRKFCELSKKENLPAPVSFYCTASEDFKKLLKDVIYPAVIKPAFKQDWWHPHFEKIMGCEYQKAFVCDTPKDLKSVYEKLSGISERAIIQEYIPGDDNMLYSVNMYVNQESEVIGIYTAQKRRVYPIQAGTGCYILTVKDKDITEAAIEIARKLKLKGLINIQFKKHAVTVEPKVIEIHARNSYWNYLGVSAGMNLAAIYYNDLTGAEVAGKLPAFPEDYKEGAVLIDPSKDFKAFLQYRKAGELSFMDWISTYFKGAAFSGFKKGDILPVLKNLQFIASRKLLKRKYKGGSEK